MIQNVMVATQARGLDTCPVAWNRLLFLLLMLERRCEEFGMYRVL